MRLMFYVFEAGSWQATFDSLEQALNYIEPTDVSITLLFNSEGNRYPLRIEQREKLYMKLFSAKTAIVVSDGEPLQDLQTFADLKLTIA